MLNYCLVFGQDKSKSLLKVFSEGEVGGHARSFYMHTFNEGSLTDYWTNAVGMSLQYESLEFHGFSMGIDGVFTFKTFSSDLNAIDSVAGKSARWEKQLYDVEHPHNSSDMDRLEELFLRYRFKKGWLRYGKFAVKKTPLLRLRDGRMKPFSFEGFQGEVQDKSLKWYVGGIYKVSPRGTTHWYSLSDAIGLFNNGFSSTGEKANYQGEISTNGLYWFGVVKKKEESGIELWSYVLDKQLSIVWFQVDQSFHKNHFGIQLLYEASIQEHSNSSNTLYIKNGSHVGVVSASFERQNKYVNFGFQSSRVFGNSRFTFPKELGLEGLYTSIPRSWIEGLGDAEVYNISLNKKMMESTLTAEIKSSYVHLNQPNNHQFNKYNIRDYLQTNFMLTKELEGHFEGLELALLYATRLDVSGEALQDKEVFNSTNYHQINLIVNFEF